MMKQKIPIFEWDLKDLYSGRESKKLIADIDSSSKAAIAFEQQYGK